MLGRRCSISVGFMSLRDGKWSARHLLFHRKKNSLIRSSQSVRKDSSRHLLDCVGDCDAGSTFVDARGNIEEDFPDVKDVVAVLTESAPIPNDNISFGPDVDADTRAALVDFFIGLTQTDEGLELLNEVYSWSGMEVVGDDFYDGFRQTLEAAGVSFEDLQ